MHSTLECLVNHGYLVLLIWVFLEQAGLPLPSIPLLLASGALIGMHRLNFGVALLICMIASVCADTIWYQLGRTRGIRILHWLCRISLEPDSCVRRTEGLFEKQGAKSLLITDAQPRPPVVDVQDTLVRTIDDLRDEETRRFFRPRHEPCRRAFRPSRIP